MALGNSLFIKQKTAALRLRLKIFSGVIAKNEAIWVLRCFVCSARLNTIILRFGAQFASSFPVCRQAGPSQ